MSELVGITVHNMVLAVKGLGKLSWLVIRSFVACAYLSNSWAFDSWRWSELENRNRLKRIFIKVNKNLSCCSDSRSYFVRRTVAYTNRLLSGAIFTSMSIYLGHLKFQTKSLLLMPINFF